jgi:carbamoyltransferase
MRGEPLILGTSSAMHNGSACLLRGNSVVAAIQEERLTRVKRDCLRPGSRSLAGDDSLAAAGVRPTDLYAVVDCSIATSGEHPLERVLGWPAVQAASSRLELFTIPHHLGHAYSAFCTSGFREALVLVIKAVARWMAARRRRASRTRALRPFDVRAPVDLSRRRHGAHAC